MTARDVAAYLLDRADQAASHTPGPWRESKELPLFIHGPNGVLVARAHESQLMGRDESAANATLIAAAPDLLDALEAILGDLQTGAPKRECTMAMALAAVRLAGRHQHDRDGRGGGCSVCHGGGLP